NNTGKARHVSRYAAAPQEQNDAIFKECSKVILPSEEELRTNSRSRSAKLRFAVKQ
ncbi:MAG: 16S rRNA (cytosine(1402)-N(4))-methyltransferase, partial [Alphaproteobacteria bacterium]|nr:16S rRNA (cytosine(1402)-N(4))-methyltransferase [Alphaproteobacteria bacterium]